MVVDCRTEVEGEMHFLLECRGFLKCSVSEVLGVTSGMRYGNRRKCDMESEGEKIKA